MPRYLDMPRYFFHLHGSGARDTDGQEFPNDAAAREEARAVATDLSRNNCHRNLRCLGRASDV
jgi:hypothetical protein